MAGRATLTMLLSSVDIKVMSTTVRSTIHLLERADGVVADEMARGMTNLPDVAADISTRLRTRLSGMLPDAFARWYGLV